MDVDKPLKRRMKIKHEGGTWSWVNFKYERLSTFSFVYGTLGHSERDCGIVYANPDKEIERAYGVWLRAPVKNMKSQNVGAKWLRNGAEDGGTWATPDVKSKALITVYGSDKVESKFFMEVGGVVREVPGENEAIRIIRVIRGKNQGIMIIQIKRRIKWRE